MARGEFGRDRAVQSGQWEAGQSVGEGFGWALEMGDRTRLVERGMKLAELVVGDGGRWCGNGTEKGGG